MDKAGHVITAVGAIGDGLQHAGRHLPVLFIMLLEQGNGRRMFASDFWIGSRDNYFDQDLGRMCDLRDWDVMDSDGSV